MQVAYRLNAPDHERRCQDGHVEMVQLLLFAGEDHRLGETVGDRLTRVHAAFYVLDHATVCLDEVFVQPLPANRHARG